MTNLAYQIWHSTHHEILRLGNSVAHQVLIQLYPTFLECDRSQERIKCYVEACQAKVERMQYLAERDVAYIYWHCMDCDHATWDGVSEIEANIDVLEQWIDSFYDGAEGPQSWRFISKEDYDNFRPTRRDLALEAFEEGHPHVIHY